MGRWSSQPITSPRSNRSPAPLTGAGKPACRLRHWVTVALATSARLATRACETVVAKSLMKTKLRAGFADVDCALSSAQASVNRSPQQAPEQEILRWRSTARPGAASNNCARQPATQATEHAILAWPGRQRSGPVWTAACMARRRSARATPAADRRNPRSGPQAGRPRKWHPARCPSPEPGLQHGLGLGLGRRHNRLDIGSVPQRHGHRHDDVDGARPPGRHQLAVGRARWRRRPVGTRRPSVTTACTPSSSRCTIPATHTQARQNR